VLTIVDPTRTIKLPDGSVVPRRLVTYVRYPAVGRPTGADHPGAPAAVAGGPFPLIIFGHGFDVTPAPYAPLLRAWAQAGYVVAAPVFPLENADAPGGPNESDLVNQPRDMSVVITALEQDSTQAGPLHGLIDPRAIAASGQSDGGETALAVAFDRLDRDPRVGAAVILSGAKIPGLAGFQVPPGSPPLLATQGTADTINPPSFTHAFYDVAPPPKYLLNMFGAGHLPPYTTEQPQLGVVERVTIAFLNEYLRHRPAAAAALSRAGNIPGIADLQADP
jgi:dienelactone hydrolase